MTSTARDILRRLADLGAEAYRQDDKLILRAGISPVPKGILTQIRTHKAEVLQALSTDAEQDDFGACTDLVWLLNGDRLVAMTESTATIETQTGARQTYHRKAYQPGRVLAWELI